MLLFNSGRWSVFYCYQKHCLQMLSNKNTRHGCQCVKQFSEPSSPWHCAAKPQAIIQHISPLKHQHLHKSRPLIKLSPVERDWVNGPAAQKKTTNNPDCTWQSLPSSTYRNIETLDLMQWQKTKKQIKVPTSLLTPTGRWLASFRLRLRVAGWEPARSTLTICTVHVPTALTKAKRRSFENCNQ